MENKQKAETELDLVLAFREAKAKRDEAEEAFNEAKSVFEAIKERAYARLTEEGKDKTAKYEGLGYIGVYKPRLRASFEEESRDLVFQFVRRRGRKDLIKKTVNAQSLSAFIGELIESGRKVPQFINYYLEPQVRMFGTNGKAV